MTAEPDTTARYTLWGAQISAYTGKVRAYLIKKGIPYRELNPSHPEFMTRVVPQAGFFVLPVLETPDGLVLQDSTAIIEYLEARHPEPCVQPEGPVQNAVAQLLSAFGSEGMNQPSMHYRWSCAKEQEAFLRAEFGRAFNHAPDRAAREAAGAPVMAAMDSYLPILGITPQTIPAIEAAYAELLAILDEHFLHHPYLLGGRPSMADFGMMTTFFAHLSRDPVPSSLMKLTAPNVFRWTERMNHPNLDDGEFPDRPAVYPEHDSIPETLEPLLAYVFRHWGCELIAATAHYNAWIAAHPELKAGDLAHREPQRRLHPELGMISFSFRGQPMSRLCQLQTLWHFDKAAVAARGLAGEARHRFEALAERTGGGEVMALRLARGMRRENNVLVLD